MRKGIRLEGATIARRIVDLLSERQAEEIVLLNLEGVTTFADYFVIASGQNVRHMQALCDVVEQDLAHEGVAIRGREGAIDSGWVLMDLGDIIVHIFAPTERAFYDLEGLWSRANTVLRIQ